MKVKLLLGLFCLAPMAASYAAGEHMKTDKEKWSYAIGVRMGQDMVQRGIDLDSKAFARAVEDVKSGKDLKLSDQEMNESLHALQRNQEAKMHEIMNKNKSTGEAFLSQNKSKAGIKTLASGVQYTVIESGTGKTPTASDNVLAHYRGTLINGTEFDSSYSRGQPATFPVGGVIQGWQEVLQLMKVGAKWKVFIPSHLAYGERGAPPSIGPNETLIFDIELLDIK